MAQEKLCDRIHSSVTQQIALSPITEFDDLKTIVTPDGKEVGAFRAFTGEKIQKFTLTEFTLMPGMSYSNASLKALPSYNISTFAFNYMVMPDRIQFDVDLYPAVDLVMRQDYIDTYYDLLKDLYLQEKSAEHFFNWKLSDHSWMRVSASPYFFMAATAPENRTRAHNVIFAYLDVALKMFAREQEVSAEQARQIAERRDYRRKILMEREPERKMVEKAFGKELTDRLGQAMS